MNHIYKKVWSRVRGSFVAVSEAMTRFQYQNDKAEALSPRQI